MVAVKIEFYQIYKTPKILSYYMQENCYNDDERRGILAFRYETMNCIMCDCWNCVMNYTCLACYNNKFLRIQFGEGKKSIVGHKCL